MRRQMNHGALSIEPWLTLNEPKKHFEMNPGPYFQSWKTNKSMFQK